MIIRPKGRNGHIDNRPQIWDPWKSTGQYRTPLHGFIIYRLLHLNFIQSSMCSFMYIFTQQIFEWLTMSCGAMIGLSIITVNKVGSIPLGSFVKRNHSWYGNTLHSLYITNNSLLKIILNLCIIFLKHEVIRKKHFIDS